VVVVVVVVLLFRRWCRPGSSSLEEVEDRYIVN